MNGPSKVRGFITIKCSHKRPVDFVVSAKEFGNIFFGKLSNLPEGRGGADGGNISKITIPHQPSCFVLGL